MRIMVGSAAHWSITDIMQTLPIASVIPQVLSTLCVQDTLILEAPPGAGKTTFLPLALLDQEWIQHKKIIMLEPRRLAAKAAAERMASQLGEKVGITIGYRVKLESCVSQQTRIEVVTEGILTRMLQSDPSLSDYGLVIFDEYHERSLNADLGLALTLEGRTLFRDEEPLKLLIMSATLDGSRIATLLNDAPVIRSEGKSYPVEAFYYPKDKHTYIEDHVTQIVLQALKEQTGSLLVFLPGQLEIRRVERQLLSQINNTSSSPIFICPLYGDLSLKQQRQAIEPTAEGARKIVLATRIAETSLTIEGISTVIDSGQSRESRFDPNTGMNRLYTRTLTQSEATQRAGRAGRLAPGVCYRLWSKDKQNQLIPFSPAEITQADLSPLALQLLCWGVNDPNELCWLDPPPLGAFQQAQDLLHRLGAIDTHGKLTAHGEKLASLPAHPRIGHMLIRGAELGLLSQACQIAALLSERDPLSRASSDLELRLNWLTVKPAENRFIWQRIHQQAKHYQRACQQLPLTCKPVSQTEHTKWIGLLVAFAYPDRIAEQRSGRHLSYRLSNGRAAYLNASDSLHKYTLLAIAQNSGHVDKKEDRITLAAYLQPELLERYMSDSIQIEEVLEWHPQEQRLISEQQHSIGQLVLKKTPLDSPSPEAVALVIQDVIKQQGLQVLPWNDEINYWKLRVMFLHQAYSSVEDNPWPDLSDTWLTDNLADWLGPYLTDVRHIKHLKKLNLKKILESLLPWPLPQQLNQLAPERYAVPSGSHIRIDYSENPPVLAVKLQEMFGCTDTPNIANGIALKLHLLSPAQRPLQVTQDLKSFWEHVYPEVKKDMKGRYPKHPWPDDPLNTVATARTTAALKRSKN